MKTIGWIATTLSLVGIILNSHMIIWCWGVWMCANVLWIYWSIKKKEWAQTILWIVFFLSNFYGLWLWIWKLN